MTRLPNWDRRTVPKNVCWHSNPPQDVPQSVRQTKLFSGQVGSGSPHRWGQDMSPAVGCSWRYRCLMTSTAPRVQHHSCYARHYHKSDLSCQAPTCVCMCADDYLFLHLALEAGLAKIRPLCRSLLPELSAVDHTLFLRG